MTHWFEERLRDLGFAFAGLGLLAVPIAASLPAPEAASTLAVSACLAGAVAVAGLWHVERTARERERAARRAEILRTELNEARRTLQAQEALLDQERDANRLKDAFLSAMSHELRTPLQGISTWVHILSASHPDEPTFTRGISAISRNAQTLTRAISEIVDVSSVVTGTMDLSFDLLDLRVPIRAAIDSVRSPSQAKYIVLDVHLPEEPCYITGDRERLQHVLSTLLSNTVRATQTGGVISVSVARDGRDYRVDVADTGIGIASDVAHPFERCHQYETATTREHGGVNLCLAIVKELAELHGGSVNAFSECLDDGSTIAIRLPALTDVHVPDAWGLLSPAPQTPA